MSPSNILDPAAVVSLLPTLLPADSKKLASSHDALAALLHAMFTALSFRLTAVNDTSISGNVLPADWNKNGPGVYNFTYKHEQSSLEFAVSLAKLGSRTLINAIPLETDKVANVDVCTEDFTSPSFYPYNQETDSDKALIHGFISSNRVTDFIGQVKLKVVQKILPGLQKEGYTEAVETSQSTSTPSTSHVPPPARPQPGAPPNAPDNDGYAPPRGGIPRNPLEIGRSDLEPFGRNPFAPPSLFPPGGGDGMFVGPDHPMFGGRDRDMGRGPWGGDGFLPPMGAPPGARFDPVGPSFPNRGPRGGFPPGRRNLGDPDNDEFMPPGVGDSMFS
ncbi:PI31 proteasome regulator N-terminal-domain-containing protein [Coprinopsis sp. MPI-PUGE-AT-0042]|nr:PI31 proteasome regulator N-terminal-domain-containing protein [Coprinopsis sp. MPI-PUGE-AT-0042]